MGPLEDSSDVSRAKTFSSPPGPIDTLSLLDVDAMAAAAGAAAVSSSSGRSAAGVGNSSGSGNGATSTPDATPLLLKQSLVPTVDCEIVGEEVYNALCQWYGVRGPPILRIAVPDPDALAAHEEAEESKQADSDDDDEVEEEKEEEGTRTPPHKRIRCYVDLYPERTAERIESAREAIKTAAAAAAATAALSDCSVAATSVGPPQHQCFACGKESVAMSHCSACKVARYCGEQCQRSHWQAHKAQCSDLKAAAAAAGSTDLALVTPGAGSGRRGSFDESGGALSGVSPAHNGLRGACARGRGWFFAEVFALFLSQFSLRRS